MTGGDAPEPEDESPWRAVYRLFDNLLGRVSALEAGTKVADAILKVAQGRSITGSRVEGGHLFLAFNDGSESDVGKIVADPPAALEFRRDASGRITGAELK